MTETYHVIKDPVHGTMQFTHQEHQWIKPFIDSAHFQRLRHVKQMGMGDLIFPGAVHTRFSHCLGCCYVACQITAKIGLNDEERQLVILACLLHDIGHGPFSHAFEGLFQEEIIRHEAWTPFFLQDFADAGFFELYNQLNPELPLNKEKFTRIVQMIMHEGPNNNALADIVSSQLDADRLDYLLRDNNFCGVNYGIYDLRWMLHCLAIVEKDGVTHLGITQKGVGTVEHYLMARRLMVKNIYHSKKKLAIEEYLQDLLISLAADIDTYANFHFLRPTNLGKFLLSVNTYNQAIKKTDNKADLKYKFLTENYQFYKGLCDYDLYSLIRELANLNNDHPAVQIAERIHYRLMPNIIRFDYRYLSLVEKEVEQFKLNYQSQYQAWQIKIVRSPHFSYSGEEEPIYVVNEHGVIQPLSDFSIMIDAISDQYEQIAFIAIDKLIAKDAPILEFIEGIQAALIRKIHD